MSDEILGLIRVDFFVPLSPKRFAVRGGECHFGEAGLRAILCTGLHVVSEDGLDQRVATHVHRRRDLSVPHQLLLHVTLIPFLNTSLGNQMVSLKALDTIPFSNKSPNHNAEATSATSLTTEILLGSGVKKGKGEKKYCI